MSDEPGRALIVITHEELANLLELPEGYRAIMIGPDFVRSAIIVGVESFDLEPVAPGTEPPVLGGIIGKEQVLHEGKLYYRWSWMPWPAKEEA